MDINSAASILGALTEKKFQKSECGKKLIATGRVFPLYTVASLGGSYQLTYMKWSKLTDEKEITINDIARRINFLETGNPIIDNNWKPQ